MGDLIERQAAINAVGLTTWAGSRISRLHAIDAVPVVRCKDCVHRGWEIECPIEDRMGDDFFCAWGEKEEDEYDS